jgi:hypothetical protein
LPFQLCKPCISIWLERIVISKIGCNVPCWSSACHFWFIQLFEVNILVSLHHCLNKLICLPSIDRNTLAGDVFQSQVAFQRLIYGDIVEWDRAGWNRDLSTLCRFYHETIYWVEIYCTCLMQHSSLKAYGAFNTAYTWLHTDIPQ